MDGDGHDPVSPTRRRVLAGAGAALLGTTAGCANFTGGWVGSEDGEDRELQKLDETTTYPADGVDLTLPEAVPTVEAAAEAELLLLPGNTGTGVEQAVDWLAGGKRLALVGTDSEPTYLDWAGSDAFTEAFDNEGLGDGSPDPQLVAAHAVDNFVYRYNHTWEGGPDDQQLVWSLDRIMVEMDREASS
jgi:hypothetical protein